MRDDCWFLDAKFGMFIHWGLYSLLKRGEWVFHMDAIPPAEYEALVGQFDPDPGCAREWASLARQAGMKYVVFTTKHHDGFCLWPSELTDYHHPTRDFVGEVVEAFRAEGLKVGLYYSLGDWHVPCYRAVAEGDASQVPALRDYLHGHVRELVSRYQPDLLWYDGAWFDGSYLTAETLDAAGLEAMARELQPRILINDRSGVPGDYATCENECHPAPFGTPWEMCICINDLWGYAEHDYNYKTVNQLLFMLANCASQGGNLLLNVSPRGDGAIPEAQVERLMGVGRWLDVHGPAIYPARRQGSAFFGGGRVTRAGGKTYLHALYWPGPVMRVPDAAALHPGSGPVQARILTTGRPVSAAWDGSVLVLAGLPAHPPHPADTVIELTR